MHASSIATADRSARTPLRYTVRYATLDEFLADYTANRALGSMFVPTRDPLEVGTRFRLGLRVPGRQRALHALAEVQWSTAGNDGLRPGMNVTFGALAPREQQRVEAWLARWSPSTLSTGGDS